MIDKTLVFQVKGRRIIAWKEFYVKSNASSNKAVFSTNIWVFINHN